MSGLNRLVDCQGLMIKASVYPMNERPNQFDPECEKSTNPWDICKQQKYIPFLIQKIIAEARFFHQRKLRGHKNEP
jgi:hypothetical protein